VCNKDFLQKIYGPHFKQIIFYSDIPEQPDVGNDVNFIDIHRGFYTERVFPHFYAKYKHLLDDSDGLFYVMDDNILNVNRLNLIDSTEILFYAGDLKPLDQYSEWFWDWNNGQCGKVAITNMMKDEEFQKLQINTFAGAFSDWFFLPKKVLTDETFKMFEIFGKYEVFLEIAIPSVINNIRKKEKERQPNHHHLVPALCSVVLWGEDRKKILDRDFVYHTLNTDHMLILHPIKFNQNPDAKQWLEDIFCKDKCVIITTINKPTETILKHIANKSYDVIIVGDLKTPSEEYKSLECIYLDIPAQQKLFPELTSLIPYNHYCRKNLGYLYAIKRGYKIIYETDDDNIPFDDFDKVLNEEDNNSSQIMIKEQNTRWINIFKYFTNNDYIWPRGFPLTLLKNAPNYAYTLTKVKPAIINGLVENDPDVDALFRIVCNHQHTISWEKDKSVIIDNQANVCVFNTQNTFWLKSELFVCLLIPSSVSFRYCDILRGIINNIVLKHTDNYMMYTSPNVTQLRNEHNLINDMKSEFEMYIHNENILDFIEDGVSKDNDKSSTLLQSIYLNLLNHGVIKQLDVDILNKWLEYF
jgi:hypothetical protein